MEEKQKVNEFCTCNMWVPAGDARLVVADNRRYHASCLRQDRRRAGKEVVQPEQQTFSFVS